MARFGRYNVSLRRPKSLMSVIKKLSYTVLSLWVGGIILNAIATAMNGTTTPFDSGLGILGFQQCRDVALNISGCTNATHYAFESADTMVGTVASTGILTVIAVIGATNIIMDFLNIQR